MSPNGGRHEPIQNFRFRVEIDGIAQAGFREVEMPQIEVETIEYREGIDPNHIRKLGGLTKYGNVTLKWGITDSRELYDWIRSVTESGSSANRKNMAIILTDEQGEDKVRWNLKDAWPVGYRVTDLNAQKSEIALEMLEITFERFTRES